MIACFALLFVLRSRQQQTTYQTYDRHQQRIRPEIEETQTM